ncbi:TPA: phosphotransferase [Pseudomonas putida]|nr:phosphotransferase [Pseudomonas putida]
MDDMPLPCKPNASRTHYRWQRAPLEQHLVDLIPHWKGKQLKIRSEELASNASFVNYVRHHSITDPNTGKPREVVEKAIRKMAFLGSQEARFHRAEGILEGSTHFHHPTCLGVIETPWESLIFTEFVRGKPPRMHAIARQLAQGIAEVEELSHGYLEGRPAHQAFLHWSMDFFRPWFLLRPRFNFARCLPALEQLGKQDIRFAGLAQHFSGFTPLIRQLAAQARHSPRCISHMDYLRKNLFVVKGQLHLIDWSEVKVGRVGFDGGAYLGSLFRRQDMNVFLAARKDFVEAYSAALTKRFDHQEALRNLHYVFLLTALFHCLRPETIKEYQESDKMGLLQEKYEYLLGLLVNK